ncbi:hypothetical protein H1R20_g9761, partial [Candolleomyces eurysporus]
MGRVDRAGESVQEMGKDVRRGVKTFFGMGKPKNQGEGATSAQDVGGSAVSASDSNNVTGGDGEATAAEEALGASAELETEASLPQPYAASSSAKDEQPVSPEAAITLIVPKPVLDEDKAATMQGIEDNPVVIGAGSGAATVPSVATDDDNKPLPEIIIASTVSAPVSAEGGGGARTTEEGVESPPIPAPETAYSAMKEPTSDKNPSKGWDIAKGTFKTALGIAVTLVPEPFKGPAEALLKVVDIVEKANSNKEEVKILKKRCDLLGSSVVNAVKGKDTKLLSEDLKDSIGRLVVGVKDTLEAANKEKSKGFTVYVLAEDDVEVLENANKKLDELLQHFWIENHIAGTIVLSDILATVHDQGGWMQGLSATLGKHFEVLQGLSATLDRHSENSALDRLKRIPGAAYDSQEVAAKVVSCFEGTRSTLLANVGRWMVGPVSDGHNPPLYVLDGIAGIGKSTVAITVAQRAAGINCLGATFFFSRDHDDRKKSLGFVHTIAYQLACYDASYGQAIASAINKQPDALDKVLAQQFNLLVAEPLCPLLEQRATPLVLVFDALDECVEPDASALLKLIISSVSQLPNTKVFLTTRPELGLRSRYMDTKDAHIFHLQEIEDLIVEKDISCYVDYCLSPLNMQETLGDSYDSEWEPAQEAKDKLIQMSGKLFIFASTAIKFILDTCQLDPEGQLDLLLSLQSSGDNPLSELDDLYSFILQSAKPSKHPEIWLGKFQKIVGAILVLQTPVSAFTLSKLLDETENKLKATLGNLHSVLAPLNEESTAIYKVHHKSFPDYITGPFCLPGFQIVETEHHLGLAKCCLEVMNKQLRFNICQVPVPSEDQYKDLDDLLKEGLSVDHISKELQNGVKF